MIRVFHKRHYVTKFIGKVQEGADSERDALGFLPPNAYKQAALQEKILVAVDENGQFAGHLLFGGVFPHCKIMQIYCVPQFRKSGTSRKLMDVLVSLVEEKGFLSISAKVASDLIVANSFYEEMGFEIVSTLPGGKTRKRLLYQRVRDLKTPSLFDLIPSEEKSSLSSLGLTGAYGEKSPIYAMDLNVVFDVSKQRKNKIDAGMVMKAGFRGDIRIVITQEFINELDRTSDQYPNDPHLQLALSMQILDEADRNKPSHLEDKILQIVFPDRWRDGLINNRDRSDARHLAISIHHGITGFITSEKAILKAHDVLKNEFGLEILSPADFAEPYEPSGGVSDLGVVSSIDDRKLVTKELPGHADSLELRAFLKGLHVPKEKTASVTSGEDCISTKRNIIFSVDNEIVSFASWEVVPSPKRRVRLFIACNENSDFSRSAIDHTFNRVCNEAGVNNPTLVNLELLPGHSITRNIALSYGFRPEPGREEHGLDFHKVAVGGIVDAQNWIDFRRRLLSLTGVELPQKIPQYSSEIQEIEIKLPSGDINRLSLLELETLLSPLLLLLPEREGAVVSIKKVYADSLLGTADQLSFFEPPEAVLLNERVYYNTPRAAAVLKIGTPILFYESEDGGGRKSIVAVGRAIDSRIIKGDQLPKDTQRKGVINGEDLKRLGNSPTKLATIFDNIMPFQKPVHISKLREIGCADGANFVTAKKIPSDQLLKSVREGFENESVW